MRLGGLKLSVSVALVQAAAGHLYALPKLYIVLHHSFRFLFFHFRLLVVFLSFVLVSVRFYHFSFSLTKIALRDSIAIEDGARYSSRWYNNRCYFILFFTYF